MSKPCVVILCRPPDQEQDRYNPAPRALWKLEDIPRDTAEYVLEALTDIAVAQLRVLAIMIYGRLPAKDYEFLPEAPQDRYYVEDDTPDSMEVLCLKLILFLLGFILEIDIVLVSYSKRDCWEAFVSRRS